VLLLGGDKTGDDRFYKAFVPRVEQIMGRIPRQPGEGREEKMKTKPWRDIRAPKFSPHKLKEIDRAVEDELLEMDLRELRAATGKTQEELAEALKKAQSEISRIESRSDYRLSTLQRYVAALGGELEVVASFGNRRVRLRAQ
jgi:DNA-binding XRE family transcriptional regulator